MAAPPAVTLTINGRSVAVPKGTTVYNAARSAGIDIPIFCYHDRMPPLGACRMCLVKVEKNPRFLTSCTQEAADGMVVFTDTPDVVEAQRAILEFLLINHPLDCPICDKGGECPLQDNTVRFGPGASRFVEPKRDFPKPVRLGPVLVLDRERCILCWRCVRFGELVAGDDALKGFERGFLSEIKTAGLDPVASKFIGNTITICPVGALTSESYRFRSRPWNNAAVPSVCNQCGLGCATTLDVRGGILTRAVAREKRDLNDVWLCDLGFFGHEYPNSHERLTAPLVRDGGALREATWDEALDRVAARLRAVRPERVAGLGGMRLLLEEAYVFARFLRGVVGTRHVDFRTDARGAALEVDWGLDIAVGDVAARDAVVLAGTDLTEEYPILWLQAKKARDAGAPLVMIHPRSPEMARHATHRAIHRAGAGSAALWLLAWGVAAALDRDELRGLDRAALAESAGVDPDTLAQAGARLVEASAPLLLVGRQMLDASDGESAWAAAQALRALLPGLALGVLRGKGNACGAALAGLVPHRLPGYRPLTDEGARTALEAAWGSRIAAAPGMNAAEIVEAASRGDLDVLYVVGSDPAGEFPDRSRWTAASERVFVVVHDLFLTETARRADVVFPALTHAEKEGSLGNIEGRVQHVRAGLAGPSGARADWVILSALAERLGAAIQYASTREIFDEMQRLIPGLADDARLLPRRPEPVITLPSAAPSPSRSDGGLLLLTGDVLFDRGAMSGRSRAIDRLAGEPFVELNPMDAAAAGIRPGDTVEVSSAHGAVEVTARVSEDLPRGQAFVPRGYDAAPANALLSLDDPTPAVRVRAPAAVAGAADG